MQLAEYREKRGSKNKKHNVQPNIDPDHAAAKDGPADRMQVVVGAAKYDLNKASSTESGVNGHKENNDVAKASFSQVSFNGSSH